LCPYIDECLTETVRENSLEHYTASFGMEKVYGKLKRNIT
jgi:hypothetical protein